MIKNKVKELRLGLNLTQEELAFCIEITRQSVQSIENGRYQPTLENAFRLAKLFNKKIEDIFYEI